MAMKMSFENKRLGNGDYFVILPFSSHLPLITDQALNGQVEELLK